MCTPVPLPARGIHVWEACVGLKAHSRGEEGLVLLDRVLLGVSPRGVLGLGGQGRRTRAARGASSPRDKQHGHPSLPTQV